MIEQMWMFGKNVSNKEFMDKELIDRGSYYEIKDYKPIVEHDESGNLVSVIYCPYIPKFLVDGPIVKDTSK